MLCGIDLVPRAMVWTMRPIKFVIFIPALNKTLSFDFRRYTIKSSSNGQLKRSLNLLPNLCCRSKNEPHKYQSNRSNRTCCCSEWIVWLLKPVGCLYSFGCNAASNQIPRKHTHWHSWTFNDACVRSRQWYTCCFMTQQNRIFSMNIFTRWAVLFECPRIID